MASEDQFDPLRLALRVLRFGRRVVAAFLRNKGILLAGGVGYNALLSLVPFLILTLAVLSSFVDQALILDALRRELAFLLPQRAEAVIDAAQAFLAHQTTSSAISVVALVIFSSLAFRMLEDAVATIFHASGRTARRHALHSALLPYLIMAVLMLAILALTVLSSVTDLVGGSTVTLFGRAIPAGTWARLALRALGFAGLVFLFAGVYVVLPVGRIPRRLAFIGGLSAAILWKLVGMLLSSYFATLSMVNVLYGSFATVVVVLLFLEGAFIIVLLGAQVIAELTASAAAGLPWYEAPHP